MRVAKLAFLVREYDEAIDWFTRCLGFVLVENADMGAGKRWVVVQPAGGQGAALLLARAVGEQREAIGRQGGGRVFLFLETPDFDNDHARMKAAGVRFAEAPRSEPYGKVAVFEDPYGNRWDLLESHSA